MGASHHLPDLAGIDFLKMAHVKEDLSAVEAGDDCPFAEWLQRWSHQALEVAQLCRAARAGALHQ